jgi:hypothetical protein
VLLEDLGEAVASDTGQSKAIVETIVRAALAGSKVPSASARR